MQYNNALTRLCNKWKQFHDDKTPGQIMVNICPYTFSVPYEDYGLKPRPLCSWDFDTEAEAFAQRAIKTHRAFLEHTKDLDNDYVPTVGINLGFGVNSAYFTGARVTFGEETSWAHPVLDDLADQSRLVIDSNNYWYRKLLEMYRILAAEHDGSYCISAFSNAGPGDMANAARGNALFEDLYDDPEQVNELFDRCAGAIIWLEESIRHIAGYINGGCVTANCWFEGDAPFLSLDFNDLVSADHFKAFDFPATQKILSRFKGAYIHHHMKGYHVHADIAKLSHLKMLEISWDPNLPKPIGRLDEIVEMHGGLPLMIRCTAQDVYEHIDSLKKGRVVLMLNVNSLDEGRETVKFIRRHSRGGF